MKRLFILIVGLVFSIELFAQYNYDSLLNVLDKTVDSSQIFADRKEKKLEELKYVLEKCNTDSLRYDLFEQLYFEYRSYKADSALKYARYELKIAEKLNSKGKLINSRIDMVSMMAVTGMYKESLDIMQNMDKTILPDIKARYFNTYRIIYENLAEYSVDQERDRYRIQISAYRDSILLINLPTSTSYVIAKADKLIADTKYDSALNLLFTHCASQSDIHKKAYIAYTIAAIYKIQGNKEREKYWLTISAINDIRFVNKQYIALRSLALIFFQEGDVNRAYKYIMQSLDDAVFCNARLRTIEISPMLPVINKAYQLQTKEHQQLLIVSLVCISMLSLFMLVAIFFVYRQMRNLSIARKDLSFANDQLATLNQKLFAINTQVKDANKTLHEANLIKEEYIGRYMDQCSIYIDKLDGYRRLLNKTALAGKVDDLLRTIKSKQFIDDELKAFYHNFDSAFLQLFPSFIKDFSTLMVDDEYVQMKTGQLLNTELRIAALMRLGITDGVRMSKFLRCSLSTIYNYRYKMKNKAIGSRDEFEEKVMKIGL